MKPQRYFHTIRFLGSAHPESRYQLKISEMGNDGQLQYRAQWNFSSLRNLLVFLNKYFPNSQALPSAPAPALSFEQVVSISRPKNWHAA